MTAPVVKICGITSAHDASLAIEAGASYIGLIFVPDTSRTVSPEALKAILRACQMKAFLVGVFQNQPLSLINELATLLPLHYIQLHGDETPGFCSQLQRPVIKAFPLNCLASSTHLETTVRPYENVIAHALFDWPKGQPGPIPWNDYSADILMANPWLPNPFLAGKLTAHNVASTIQRFHPYGIDIASGVESQPGQKDPDKLKQLFTALQRANS